MNKKLYRGNGYIGGVCQGLGEWSGIPSILWRVGLLFVIPGPAIIIYLILWIFLKKDLSELN
jgi:phage shock protein PspC (stress-responsive transcriptional regulator)